MCLRTALRFEFEVAPLGNGLEVNGMLLLGGSEVVLRVFSNGDGFIAADGIFGLGDEHFGSGWFDLQTESGLSINRHKISFVPRMTAADIGIGCDRRFCTSRKRRYA